MIQHRFFRLVSVLIIGAFSVQCGKEGLSKNVSFRTLPNDPIVILTDLIIPGTGDGDDRTISGPWFQFQYEIQNSTDFRLIIASITFKIRYTRDRALLTQEAEFQISDNCDDDDPIGIKRVFFAELPPNSPVTSGFADACTIDFPLTPPTYETIIMGGLAEADQPFYRIEVVLTGWFADPDSLVPVERFTKSSFMLGR